MHHVLTFLAAEPILLLMILLAIGSIIGAVRFRSVGLGPAAVLFAAIAFASIGAADGTKLEIPSQIGTLGLVLFTYTVGLVSGPSFFPSLRRGWKPMLLVIGVFVAVAAVGVGLGQALGLRSSEIAGAFAGALTNTPALAAATERSGDPVGPTIGYSLAYVWGVLGLLIAAGQVLSKRQAEDSGAAPLVNRVVRVDRTLQLGIDQLEERHGGRIVVSRIQHGEENPIILAEGSDTLRKDDLVAVVGPESEVMEVVDELGHLSSHHIVGERTDLDYRRITLSNPKLAGRPLEQLEINEKFGANVTRVRRGDVDFVAHGDFVVQLGDRLRVIAPAKRIPQVSRFLGDSERGLSDINPIGFALGLAIGVAIGMIEIPLPGGGFALGEAAGTLIVGLIFGRLGRVGPVVVSMPNSAATTLSTFGMLTFLAYAGSRAGDGFVKALASDLGWKILVLGLVLTTLSVVSLAVIGRGVLHLNRTELAGVLAGAHTQPAALAFANERTNYDQRVGLGYALVYPAAMIGKILIAQILAGL